MKPAPLGSRKDGDEVLALVRQGIADCGVSGETVEGGRTDHGDRAAIDATQFPDTAPAGTLAPALFALLSDAGVAGNVAHCTIVTSYERGGGEEALVPLLLASDPAALDTVREAGADCGAAPDQVDAAIAAGTGG